jgi:ribosomal protein S12 methylthiotransferase
MRQLDAAGFRLVSDPAATLKADAVIINTCGFILDARNESIDTILEFALSKKKGFIRSLFVMGCLSQRYREQLEKELPEVDGFFGVNELDKIVGRVGGEYRQNLLGERKLATPSHYAYLKIAEGCDRKCSFCAIPMIRGGHVSRPLDEIVREAEYLAGIGVKEINVISQDSTYYGMDTDRSRKLPMLLEKLSMVEGLEWIRLHYAYPDGFPLRVLDVMRDNPKICRYVDIPLQHISPRILRSMKRGISRQKTLDLINTIRARVPGVAIRTSLIVGYPGETKDEFEELLDFVYEQKFERLGVFTYSHEEGTAAFSLKDDVPAAVKRNRAGRVMRLQEKISLSHNQRMIGQTVKVIMDRREGGFMVGRTEFDSPEVDNEVLVKSSSRKIRTGGFCHVRITEASDFDLVGEFID